MAFVRIEQRNAHLAGPVRLDYVKGTEGSVAKATLIAVSNSRRGGEKDEEATALQWTLWGRQAENAAEFLGKGSHVNVVGRVQNNNYERDGETVYTMAFTAEEIDYLDSRAESEARRNGGQAVEGGANGADQPSQGIASRKSRNPRQPAHADA